MSNDIAYSDAPMAPKLPHKDLLEIIGRDAERLLEFRDQRWYTWECNVAIPRLKALGYTILKPFTTLEGDSCGPLSRGVRVMKNGVTSILWYG
jgi:hypothetical protein